MVDVALLHPERLWALLGLPVLFWLALPPRPRRIVGTAHWGPWQRALERAGHRPVRLRRLRFWLLACAFAAAVCAWAGVRVGGRDGPSKLEVVIDGSASMAAVGDGGELLTAARDAVADRWAKLDPGVDVAVVQVGQGLRLWRGRGGAVPDDWQDGAGAGGVGQDMGGLGVADDPVVQRWVLTDGAVGLTSEGALSVAASGGANASMEIDGDGVVDRWPLPELQVTVAVQHSSGAALRGQVVLEGAVSGSGAEPVAVELESGARAVARWDVDRAVDGGVLRARWEGAGDALPVDDFVEWRLAPLPQPRITVLTDGDGGPWVVPAAELLADRTGGTVVEAAAGAEVAFLIVDGGRLDVAGVPRGLFFGTVGGDGDGVGAPWIGPRVADWDREHPLTVGLDFSELRVGTAWSAAIPAGAEILVAGEDGPLIGVVKGERGAYVHTAFRLGDSNLPLLAAFPQLLQRSFAAGWGATRSVELLATGARSVPAAERVLPERVAVSDRPLKPFREAPWDPGPWLLAFAALLLAVRVYA